MNQPAQTIPRRPRYYAFPPRQLGDAVFGIEKFNDNLSEVAPLHKMHYEETEAEYLDDPYDPNYDHYIRMEENGEFVQFTCRIGLKVVGYLLYYVFRDMHSRTLLVAREDALFVHPLMRGKKIAPMLVSYAEDALRALGCRLVGMTSKAPVGAPDIGPALEANGYRPVAVYYVKKLES